MDTPEQVTMHFPASTKHTGILQLLAGYEATIERGLQTFTEVGNALLAIRDGRLYREKGFETFEVYCRERWGMRRRQADRLIGATQVVDILRPMGLTLPTSERQARELTPLKDDEEAILEVWREVHEEHGDAVTAATIKRAVTHWKTNHTLGQPMQVLLSHQSIEYYTPIIYIEAAREVLGGIDLDPASCEFAQRTVKAVGFYTKEDDGLQCDWRGRVWLNPPYSKTNGKSNQATWSRRLVEEYRAGNVTAAVLLVKSALGYNWFEDLWDDWPVCFVRRRLSFTRSDGTNDGQSKHSTALFYLGHDIERFRAVFCRFGRVIMPDG